MKRFYNKSVTLRGVYSLSIPATVRKPPDAMTEIKELYPSQAPEMIGTHWLTQQPSKTKLLLQGPYAVARKGEVYSFYKQRWLVPAKHSSGYLQVFLTGFDGGKGRWFKIHRLVATLFVINKRPDIALEVNHIDGDKMNNHYKNLEWVTHAENIGHAVKVLKKSVFGRGVAGFVHPMSGRKASIATKIKQSVAKRGERHPMFKGYYLYQGESFTSIAEVAQKIGVYPQKAYRMFKKGLIVLEKI